MSIIYRKSMDALYLACVGVAGSALVLISAVIPWGVYTRYVVNRAASWPEPMAVLLTIVLTFIGAAACYRSGNHMSVSVLVRMLSGSRQRFARFSAEALVGALAIFVVHLRQPSFAPRRGTLNIADFPDLVGRIDVSADPHRPARHPAAAVRDRADADRPPARRARSRGRPARHSAS